MFKKRSTSGLDKSGYSPQHMLDNDMKQLPSVVYHSDKRSKVGRGRGGPAQHMLDNDSNCPSYR